MTSWPSKSTLQRNCSILQVLRYTTSEKSGPSWQSMLHNFLSRPLSFLGWTTAMLFCSSGWTSIKHNQTSTNDSECSGTTGLQRAQKNPCYTSLHLIALATSGSSHQVQDTDACIQNNHRLSTLLLPLTITNLHPSRVRDLLVSDAFVVPSQRGSKSLSRTFSFTIPGWWNNLPTPIGMLDPCQSSSNNWKLISFGTTWLHPKLVLKKKKKKLSLSLLSFSC